MYHMATHIINHRLKQSVSICDAFDYINGVKKSLFNGNLLSTNFNATFYFNIFFRVVISEHASHAVILAKLRATFVFVT